MPRVIQDSDDEDAVSDDAQPAAVEEEATTSATATSDEASQPIKAVASAITKSTSSSEKLRREIQIAHTALLEPTPAHNRKRRAADDFDIPSSPAGKNQSKPKRARTMEHSSGSRSKGSTASLKTPSNKQTQATEDSSKISFDWEVPRSSPDAVATKRTQRQTSGSAAGTRVNELRTANRNGSVERQAATDQQDELSPHDTIMDTSSSNRGTGTGSLGPPIQGTQFEEHNPNELFPDSTLANTETEPTQDTEEDVVSGEAATAEADRDEPQGAETSQQEIRLDSVDELQPPSQPSQHTSREERSERADGRGTEPISSGKIVWTKRTPKPITPQDDVPKSPRQANSDELIGLPKEQYKPRPSRSRGGGSTQDTAIDLTMPPPPSKARKSRPSRSKTTGFTFASPKSKLLEMGFTSSQADWALMQSDGNADEAVNLLTGGTPKDKKGTQRTRRPEIFVEDRQDGGSAEEDAVPVEPRKGRKQKRTLEPQDEEDDETETIHAKHTQSRKRNKTVVPGEEEEEQESEDDAAGDRAKRKKREKGTSEAKDQDEEVADASDAEDDDDEHEIVAPRSKRKKLGAAPEPDVAEDKAEHNEPADGASGAAETSKQKKTCQTVQTPEEPPTTKKKKGRGRPRKSDAVVQEEEASASEHESEHEVEEEEPPAQKGKKKGRGRPKKAQQAPEQPAAAPVTEPSGKTHAADAQVQTPLQEKDANTPRTEATPASEPAPTVREGETAQTPSGKATEEHQMASPQKKHSPLNKGRVPFKIGLSRRMRIEPLLKIVKKK